MTLMQTSHGLSGPHETDVATDVHDNPAQRGEMSVGAERP